MLEQSFQPENHISDETDEYGEVEHENERGEDEVHEMVENIHDYEPQYGSEDEEVCTPESSGAELS